MRHAAPLLTAALTILACKAEPIPVVEPTPTPAPSEQPPPPADPRGHWVGSLALPNNQILDWAIAIEPAADAPEGELVAHLWIPTQMLIRT
ncbi:MAG TPA: hypothetical protein VM869_22710, partial [Enhygromyxa sp.]|nr:hypothetical protein [Enhygromyxa sp.]